jgi:conjugal transfer mating pair stabilization protein TraG
LSAFKQFGDRVSRDRSFVNAISTDGREAQEISARLSSTTARSERAEAALAQRTAFAQRVSTAASTGETISIDIAQDPHNLSMFMRYAQQYGGDSAAAQALMASELARQSLRPNRVFSDGTAVPNSFESVKEKAQQDRGDPKLSPELNRVQQDNVQRVRQLDSALPVQQARPTAPALRSEVQQRGEEIRAGGASATSSFDNKAEVVQTENGTLKSNKSLTVQSMRQVGKDAMSTLENAGEVLDNLKK